MRYFLFRIVDPERWEFFKEKLITFLLMPFWPSTTDTFDFNWANDYLSLAWAMKSIDQANFIRGYWEN